MVLVGQRTQTYRHFQNWMAQKSVSWKMCKTKTRAKSYIHSSKIIVQFSVNGIWLRCRIYVWSLCEINLCVFLCVCVSVCSSCGLYMDRIDIKLVFINSMEFLPDVRTFVVFAEHISCCHISFRSPLMT